MKPDSQIEYQRRMAAVPKGVAKGPFVERVDAARLLAGVIHSGDRVILEGDNQKQARFLAQVLASQNPSDLHDLHMLMSAVELDEHIQLFERGLARKLDFAFSGPQAKALARLVREGRIEIGAIHTYLELYSRYFTDLRPNVALLAGETADRNGNVFLGCNAEETATLCEATHAGKGIVIVQVEKVVETLPRVDIPADRIEFVVVAGERPFIQPLFTRDPARITPEQIMIAMLTIKGIYAPYGVRSINHGIGYAAAAVELLLPTFGAELGLKGRVGTHWVLNPHPTLIPAIEAGFVESICAFGSEPGMEEYIAAHPDVFFTSHDGGLMSNRLLAQVAGHYAIDCFAGATLQIDRDGNSSTATAGRISGFGGAPNLGASPPGRRHTSPAWLQAGAEMKAAGHSQTGGGRKLTVQLTSTVSGKDKYPVFVEELDGQQMVRQGLLGSVPIMLYAEDVTHIITELGIAFLLRCRNIDERRAAIRAVAGDTPVGRQAISAETRALRDRQVVLTPSDLGIRQEEATKDRLAARDLLDLVRISGGLYQPPRMMIE